MDFQFYSPQSWYLQDSLKIDVMTKAPYNFVPLSDIIYYPDWSDFVSIDIPFSDGKSGKIEYTLKAQTPIFVRNGQAQNESVDSQFSNYDNKYFIPATTVKGCIRNALTIISFGKFNTKYGEGYTLREEDNSKRDLAETIFGAVDDLSLKGRVQFSHCMLKNNIGCGPVFLNLLSPHPEIHSLYGKEQNQTNGRKRYVMKDSVHGNVGSKKSESTSELRPLNSGATFNGIVYFHNLLPVELGALLSALTFFGAEDKFCHQMGQGKPYGYGRVSLSLDELCIPGESYDTYYDYIEKFIKHMNDKGFAIEQDTSIKEFMTLSSQIQKASDTRFHYMTRNDERDASKLSDFSKIINKKTSFPDKEKVINSIKKKSESQNASGIDKAANERAQLIEQLKELILKGNTYYDEKNYTEAKTVYENVINLWETNTVIDFADTDLMGSYASVIKNHLNICELEKPKESLQDFLKRCSSLGNLFGTLKKNLKPYSDDESRSIYETILRLLNDMKPRDRSQYLQENSKKWAPLKEIVGEKKQKDWINKICETFKNG